MVCVQGVSSLTSVHVVHGAQHVVGGAGQAADAEAAVGALVPGVSTGGEREYIHNIVEARASLHDQQQPTIVPNRSVTPPPTFTLKHHPQPTFLELLLTSYSPHICFPSYPLIFCLCSCFWYFFMLRVLEYFEGALEQIITIIYIVQYSSNVLPVQHRLMGRAKNPCIQRWVLIGRISVMANKNRGEVPSS